MARSRYKIFEDGFPYFMTCSIVNWLPLFTNPDTVKIVLDSLSFLQSHERLILYAYVIMEDHLHLVAASDNLSKETGDFKSFTARRIIDYFKMKDDQTVLKALSEGKQSFKKDRDYQFWQEGSHPQQIQTREMMIQEIEYIHHNPVRKGLAEHPSQWKYSSIGNYLTGEGLIPICTDW